MHKILFKKLEMYDVTSTELQWFSGYLILGLHRIATNSGPFYELKNFGALGLMGGR